MIQKITFPWFEAITNFAWIFGLAMILAALSIHDFVAHKNGIKLGILLREVSFKRPLVLGAILVIVGAGLATKNRWLAAASIIVSLELGAASFKLFKSKK